MTREDEAKNERLFDSRTVERNIRKGLITRKDYEKYLKGLADATDKIAPPEAPRSAAPSAIAEVDRDHLDAGLGEGEGRHAEPPPRTVDGQSASDLDAEGDGEIADLDDEDLEEDDDVETEPPRN